MLKISDLFELAKQKLFLTDHPVKQDKPQTKTVTITVRDDKMILCCDSCYEVQPVDPVIKAWLGSERTGQFEAVVTPNSVDIRRKLATT
jgi:hypothetical protein